VTLFSAKKLSILPSGLQAIVKYMIGLDSIIIGCVVCDFNSKSHHLTQSGWPLTY